MRGPTPIAALLAVLPTAAAHAAWPEDVSLSGMTSFEGIEQLDSTTLGADYERVVRQLGAAIAGSPLPAYTLGASGFEVAVEVKTFFVDIYRDAFDEPAPWERVQQDNDPGAVMVSPGISVRKGLPFSIELGMNGHWIASSRQGIFGGYARVAIVEQYNPWPDIALHLDYNGYVGNDELELGTLVFGGTIGGLFHTGPEGTIRAVRLAPYADVSLLVVYATPVLDEDVAEAIGAVAFGGSEPSASTLPVSAPLVSARFTGGLEIVGGNLVIRLSGGYTLEASGHAAVSVGFTY